MTSQRLAPVTLALLGVSLAIYMLLGPATDAARFRTLGAHLVGVLRHGDASHLTVNVIIIALAGPSVEERIGSARMVLLILALALFATLAEFALAGPGFVGLSGVAYGLAAFALLSSYPNHQHLLALGILALLAMEWAALRTSLSVYAHSAGALMGGGIAMLGSLFATKGVQLKKMEWAHVAQVLPIIEETDDDDAREAEETFLRDGFENMFVLMDGRTVMGVTGFGVDDDVPDLAWLSWTYLAEKYHGQGYGRTMVNDLLGMLAKQGVRKIFIETSDYSENGVCIYASAHRLYEELGASLELTVPDYHDVGEAKLIFGLDNPEFPAGPKPIFGEQAGVALMALQDAPETEDVASIQWEEIPQGLTGVDITLSNARERGFRMAVLALPQDLSEANFEALGKNFRRVGRLADYYGPDFGQDWWVASLGDDT